jgi:hypothetical protein
VVAIDRACKTSREKTAVVWNVTLCGFYHIPEDSILRSHHPENHKSYIVERIVICQLKQSLGYELKHKACFDEGYTELLNERIQDPSDINGDNVNNVRCEASKHFMDKMKQYLKDKIDMLATNYENKSITDLCRGENTWI